MRSIRSAIPARYSAAALASIVALTLAGCGSSGSDNDNQLVSSACEATTGDGSVVVGSDPCGGRDGQVQVGVGWQQPVGNGGVAVGYGDGSCR